MIVIIIYACVGALLIGLGILLYARAAASRERYVCPHCGEVQTVELMKASRCNSCGTPFERPRN